MATFLAICQEVCDSVGIDRPTTVIGSTGDTEKRLVACALEGGEELMRRHDWTVLQQEYTFDTVASDDEYDLPDDFDRFIMNTAWDRDAYWKTKEALSPAQWQMARSGVVQPLNLTYAFRLKRGTSPSQVRAFFLDPEPTANDITLVYEYISNSYSVSSGGLTQAAWAADTDLSILDARLLKMDLKWRLQQSLGLSYQAAADSFERAADAYWGRDGGAQNLCLGNPAYDYDVNIQEANFGL